jgi:hypothetical protein
MTAGVGDRRDLWCIALLAGIATIFFADVFFAGSNFYYRDLFIYHFPMKKIVRDAMLSGEFPFWNRAYSNGQPIAANPAYELFYPPQWLILAGSYPFGFALHIVFHVYAALIGMFLLLRTMTLGRPAAVFGALSFGLGGLLMGSMTMLPTFFVWALAPFVGWGVLRAIRDPSASRIALAALLAGVQLIIGEPMALAQVWLLIVVGTLWFFPRRAGALAATLIIALFVAAVQMVPAIDHAHDSARSRGIAFNVVRQYSMPPSRPIETVIPHFYGTLDPFAGGYWGASYFDRGAPYLSSVYDGIGVAILVLAGLILRARGAGALLAIGAVSYLLAIGDRTPLLRTLYDAGIARGIRYPEKFAAMGVVAMIVFAASVADRLLAGDERVRRAAIIAGLIVVAISVLPLATSFAPPPFGALARNEWLIGLAFAAVAAILVVLLPKIPRRIWLLAAFAFVLLDVVLIANELVTRMPRPFFTPPDVITSFERDHDAYAVMHRGEWTSEDPNNHALRGKFGPWFARNGLQPFTLDTWGVHTALELDFDETALLPTHDLLDAMMKLGNSGFPRWAESFAAISNVRYLVDYRPLPQVLAQHLPLGQLRLVRLTHLASTGRYYFPQQIVQARTPDDVVSFIAHSGIQRPIAFVPFAPPQPSAARVLHVNERANAATIDVECTSEALLVATVTRHKYWRTTIDGQPATSVPVNLAYQGVVVPAGKHRIEMRYRNPLVLWGGLMSALAAAACVVSTAIGKRH